MILFGPAQHPATAVPSTGSIVRSEPYGRGGDRKPWDLVRKIVGLQQQPVAVCDESLDPKPFLLSPQDDAQ